MTHSELSDLIQANNNRIPLEAQSGVTVHQLIHYMNTHILADGKVDCPICKSHVQIYKRTVSRALVYYLYALRILSNDGVKYIKHKIVDQYLYDRLKLNASDYILLKWVGLIEPRMNEQDASTGEFTITSLGKSWLDGHVTVPKYHFFANGKMIKVSPDKMSIDDAKNFNKIDLTKLG
jgi:hypothetical protein